MKNFIADGTIVDMTLAINVTGGVGYTINDIVGVATRDAVAGTRASILLMGVVKMPKLSTDVMPAGRAVYWDDTNKRLTVTVGANKKFGFTVTAAASGDLTVEAYLYALS